MNFIIQHQFFFVFFNLVNFSYCIYCGLHQFHWKIWKGIVVSPNLRFNHEYQSFGNSRRWQLNQNMEWSERISKQKSSCDALYFWTFGSSIASDLCKFYLSTPLLAFHLFVCVKVIKLDFLFWMDLLITLDSLTGFKEINSISPDQICWEVFVQSNFWKRDFSILIIEWNNCIFKQLVSIFDNEHIHFECLIGKWSISVEEKRFVELVVVIWAIFTSTNSSYSV